ncbi:MAG TPA: DNA mismatch repair endonuclease MutL, partial [Aggregatilineales bacterium]|nr:DNA mismatch repair endonuclease MutL [Aggregatilineales bacterium]
MSAKRHIHVLSEVVASQIAAGEVVERPSSVVKELLENSLDAGAHLIRVEVQNGGRRLIRVTDDGYGIPADEADLAFARHATSKLQTIDDLDHIQTLGFRGEALASIASVAQVTLATRTADEPVGVLIRVDGGRKVDQRSVGTPVGTVIAVENLFYNTPARLKFMKAETTERRHIDAVVTRYAMAYPNIRFSLMQDGRTTFAAGGSGGLVDVLVEVFGIDTMRDMIPVEPASGGPITVYGYTSVPALNRNTRNHITLFVNGRYIQDTSLSYAVSQAYHTLMAEDRHPIAVLMIALPPEDVDVNVHPTKSEVRFRNPDAVFSAIQRAVRRTVIDHAPVPGVTPQSYENTPGALPAFPGILPDRQPFERRTQFDFDLALPDAGRRTQQIAPHEPYREVEAEPQPRRMIDTSPNISSRPRTLPPMRIVGQIAATYIVAEGPAGLYLVDQHAAHERILYEQFMAEHAAHQIVSQRTITGLTVELGSESARQIEENLEPLHSVGFEIEPFGANTFNIRAVPALLADRVPRDVIATILDDIEAGDAPGESTLEAKIILRVC